MGEALDVHARKARRIIRGRRPEPRRTETETMTFLQDGAAACIQVHTERECGTACAWRACACAYEGVCVCVHMKACASTQELRRSVWERTCMIVSTEGVCVCAYVI